MMLFQCKNLSKKGKLLKSMSKDPAFLFYSSDFLTGSYFMSDEQVGKYVRLLCCQHQKGRLSKEEMLNICKEYDKIVFDKFQKDAEGLFYNPRLESEMIKRKKFSESRRNNRLGKVKKVKKSLEDHKKKTSKTHVKHMENENENEDININEVEIFPTFEDFWNVYDYKVGKVKAEKLWNQIKIKEKLKIFEAVQIYVNATPDKKYRKHPATYLNNKSWNDEINLNTQIYEKQSRITDDYIRESFK